MKNYTNLLILSLIVIFVGCQQLTPPEQAAIEKGTTKIAIMYPKSDSASFDMDYYANKHMPMAAELFGDAMIDYKIEKGVAGRTPDEPMPYVAIGYFYFNSLEEYQKAFGPNAEKILSDIPNYTNIKPMVQISEVVR